MVWRYYGRRVGLIGHKPWRPLLAALDGHCPDRVSHANPMGADLRGLLGASAPALFAVGVAPRVGPAFGRARRETCLTGHYGYPFGYDYAGPFPFEQVRLTSIYSKGDSRSTGKCQVIPHADCVEVTASYIGRVFNGKVYRVVAEALALLELATD